LLLRLHLPAPLWLHCTTSQLACFIIPAAAAAAAAGAAAATAHTRRCGMCP
jgi:hypothetical protein